MAHGLLQSLKKDWEVCSAGTKPEKQVNPNAIKVMAEEGIDISHHVPKSVNVYLGESWDYVITVCGGANESCPVFAGKVKHRIHIGFDDPANVQGEPEYVLGVYRQTKDQIKETLLTWIKTI